VTDKGESGDGACCGVGFQVSCAVVHESCADCPTTPAPIRHGVLLRGLVGSSHACVPLANPPHLYPHPCGSAQGSWDFLQDRRRVCGTIRASRAEQRPSSHLQLAHFTWNPTPILIRSHARWAVTHIRWAKNPTPGGPSDATRPAPATARRAQGYNALRQAPRSRLARRRRADWPTYCGIKRGIGPRPVGFSAHGAWDTSLL